MRTRPGRRVAPIALLVVLGTSGCWGTGADPAIVEEVAAIERRFAIEEGVERLELRYDAELGPGTTSGVALTMSPGTACSIASRIASE